MTLTNIDYGSLASSEVLNKNFLYLEEKIVDTADTITTSISSMLSNIATLNTRIGDVSEDVTEVAKSNEVNLENAKSEIGKKICNYSMVPNWSACVAISTPNSYVIPSNGYLLLIPSTTSSGNLSVNGTVVRFKNCSSGNDYASILVSMPVKNGDIVTCSTGLANAYFLPVIEEGI